MPTKTCANCKEEKPLPESFHRQKDSKDGFRSWCKVCRIGPCAEYNARAENKKKRAKYDSKRQARPEVRSAKNEANLKYRNTPGGIARYAEYRKTAEVRSSRRASNSKREAAKRNQTPDCANQELIKKIYLNCPEGYHVEHMRPIARGGFHNENNLCYLPARINLSKNDKTIHEFGQQKFHSHAIYWQDVL